MTTNHPTPSKPRRRWFQYSLGSLFVLLTVLCVWLGVKTERVRKEREAVAAIEELGGTVHYEYQYDGSGKWVSRAKPPGPKWLRELVGEEYFVSVFSVGFIDTSVGFFDPQITDACLVHLKGLNNLKELGLSDTQVTDAGLIHLKGLTKLEWLLQHFNQTGSELQAYNALFFCKVNKRKK